MWWCAHEGNAEAASGRSPGGQAGSAMEAASTGLRSRSGRFCRAWGKDRVLSRPHSGEETPHLESVCVQGWEFRTRISVSRYFASLSWCGVRPVNGVRNAISGHLCSLLLLFVLQMLLLGICILP